MNTQTKPASQSRFRRYFPIAAWMVQHTWQLLPVFVALAGALSAFSIHYGLSVLCIWISLLCYWVDRKHLEYCILTPLQATALMAFLSTGVGIALVEIDLEGEFSYGFLIMQLTVILGYPFLIVGYHLVTRKMPGFVFPRFEKGENRELIRPLILIGWFCLAMEVARTVAGIVSGASDRGYAGDFVIENRFGLWVAFYIFQRLQVMTYLLVPLIWRESRLVGKVLVGLSMLLIVFLNFLAASRGATFRPLLITVLGCFMFLELRRFKYEIFLAIVVVALAPVVTLMSMYRSSQAFRQTDIRNVWAKLGTLKEGLAMQAEQKAKGERFSEAGRGFIGVADALIYEMTPDQIPHEGWDRIQDIRWAFVPYMFSQNQQRPVMQDGYQIVSLYQGFFMERMSVDITWPAEMYRRWGWLAMPVGLFLYGVFYGVVFRWIYRIYFYRDALWGFLMCGLFFNFFIDSYFHTVLNVMWCWLYDTPKHLLLLGGLYLVTKTLCRVEKVPGVLTILQGQNRGKAAPRAWRANPRPTIPI